MYRGTWELTVYTRQHIASLADEWRASSSIVQEGNKPARRVTRLRHRLGLALIGAGRALVGHEVARGFPAPPARPAPAR